MLIEISILFTNGYVEVFKDMIENENELSLFEKIFSDSIVRIKTHFNQYVYFRPSQVLSINIKQIEKTNNTKKIKEIKKIEEVIEIPNENNEENQLLSIEDDIIMDAE
jgi:hypothetical protein